MHFRTGVVLYLAILATLGIYYTGVNGPFLLDDFSNLSPIGYYVDEDPSQRAVRYIFGNKGDDYLRSVSRATFLLDTHVWPVDSRQIKLTNIALHLISGLLLFWMLLKIGEVVKPRCAPSIALLASTLWLLHPLNVSTTLYAIQRLAQLSTIFILSACLCFLYLRRTTNIYKFISLAFGAICCVSLAVLSKENGILALPIIAIIHWVMAGCNTRVQSMALRKITDCAVVLGALAFMAVLAWYGFEKVSYSARDFSMADRLAVQPLVLLHYLKFLLVPSISGMSLYHDDYELLLGVEGVHFYALLWLAHGVLIGVAVRIRSKIPLVALGILLFYAGHILESTFIQLELMFEHRNYLSGMGVMLVLADLIIKVTRSKRLSSNKPLVYGVPILFVGMCAILCTQRAAIWNSKVALATKWAYEQPRSKRAQIEFTHTLAAAGLYGMAMGELEENYVKFDDIYFQLKAMELTCLSNDVENKIPVNVGELAYIPYNSATTRQLGRLGSMSDISCIENQLQSGGFIDLIGKVGSMNLLQPNSRQYAVYLQTAFAISKRLGEMSEAEKYVKLLSKRQKTVDTALIAAEHFLTVGDLATSREYLQVATNRMHKQRVDRAKEINSLKFILEQISSGL